MWLWLNSIAIKGGGGNGRGSTLCSITTDRSNPNRVSPRRDQVLFFISSPSRGVVSPCYASIVSPSPDADQEEDMLVDEDEGIQSIPQEVDGVAMGPTLPSSGHLEGQDSDVMHVQGPSTPALSPSPEASIGSGPKPTRHEETTVPTNPGVTGEIVQQPLVSPLYADKASVRKTKEGSKERVDERGCIQLVLQKSWGYHQDWENVW